MAEGLSAVATKASPRAVASGFWSAMRMPRPKLSDGTARIARAINVEVDFIMVEKGVATIMLAADFRCLNEVFRTYLRDFLKFSSLMEEKYAPCRAVLSGWG